MESHPQCDVQSIQLCKVMCLCFTMNRLNSVTIYSSKDGLGLAHCAGTWHGRLGILPTIVVEIAISLWI